MTVYKVSRDPTRERAPSQVETRELQQLSMQYFNALSRRDGDTVTRLMKGQWGATHWTTRYLAEAEQRLDALNRLQNAEIKLKDLVTGKIFITEVLNDHGSASPDRYSIRETRATINVAVTIEVIDLERKERVSIPWNIHRTLRFAKASPIGTGIDYFPNLNPRQLRSANGALRDWEVHGDWPDVTNFIGVLKVLNSDDEITGALSLETVQGIVHVVTGLQEKAVELLRQDELEDGFKLFELAHKLQGQIKQRLNTFASNQYQSELREAENELNAFVPESSTDGGNTGSGFTETQLRLLTKIGGIHLRNAQYEKALGFYKRVAGESCELLPTSKSTPHNLCAYMGELYAQQGEYSKAIECYERSIAYHESRGRGSPSRRYQPRSRAGVIVQPGKQLLRTWNDSALKRIGDFYVLKSDYVKALEYYKKSGRGDALIQLNEWLDDYHSILHYYLDGIDDETPESVSQWLDEIGDVNIRIRKLDFALIYLKRLQQFYDRKKNEPGSESLLPHIAFAQYVTGLVYFGKGQNDLAVQYLVDANKTKNLLPQHQINSPVFEKLIQQWLAVIYASQGDTSLPHQLLEEPTPAIPEREIVWEGRLSVSATLTRLGDSFLDRNNTEVAWRCYQKAAALADDLSERLLTADRLREIGDRFLQQSDVERALVAYQLALSRSDRCCQDRIVLEDFGRQFGWQTDYGVPFSWTPFDDFQLQSTIHHDREVKWRHYVDNESTPSAILFRIGAIYSQQKRYKESLDSFQRSLNSPNPFRPVETPLVIADIYTILGDYERAMEYNQRAKKQDASLFTPYLLLQSRILDGRIYRALKDKSKAKKAFEEAINVVESERGNIAGAEPQRLFFFQERLSAYHELISLLVADGQNNEALRYADLSRARVLLETMRPRKLRLSEVMSADEKKADRNFKTRLAFLNKRIHGESTEANTRLVEDLKRARLEYQVFQLGVYGAHPELRKEPAEIRGISTEEQDLLVADPNTVVIEYVVTDEALYLFLLAKANESAPPQVTSFVLPVKRKELEERVSQFRGLIMGKSNNFRASASALYPLLLGNARANLAGKSKLIIIPDGVLWELPFQALQTPTGRYLIEDFAVSYAPSLATLREMSGKHNTQPDELRDPRAVPNESLIPIMLAIGNPTPGAQNNVAACTSRNGFGAIPETEREVRALVNLYGSARTGSKGYIGPDASEENVKKKAGKYKILHLATHGVFDNSSPLDSYVVLANPNSRSGVHGSLSAREILDLRLRADLVVLSACETGRGNIGAGEGLVGMTWALAAAGAPTIVASQWKVNSCSTTELMIEFHRRFKHRVIDGKKDVNAPDALRQASMALMKKDEYQHPFFWAGFIVLGDGR